MNEFLNNPNFEFLKEILKNSEKIAAFVGAGSSKFLGIPDWTQLLERMKKEFHSNIDVKASIKEIGYPRTATKIYETINDHEAYLQFLSNQFIPKQGTHYSLHNKILNLFRIILTTNFDSSFEEAFEDRNLTLSLENHGPKKLRIQELPDLKFGEILSGDTTLIYLHGSKKNNIYIFKQDEYECHYPSLYNKSSSVLENFLRALFLEFNLVFIGFSFNDIHFTNFFKKVVKEEFITQKSEFEKIYKKKYPNEKLPTHFVIISEDDINYFIDEKTIIDLKLSKNIINDLFYKNEENNFEFKENAEKVIKSKLNNHIKKESLLLELSKSNENRNRAEFFKELDIKVISFKSKNYNDIENILKSIIKEMKPLQYAKLEEAAYAE